MGAAACEWTAWAVEWEAWRARGEWWAADRTRQGGEGQTVSG